MEAALPHQEGRIKLRQKAVVGQFDCGSRNGAGMLTYALHIRGMTKPVPSFQPEMTKSGRWFVAVKTGNGPDSHIGDFDTEAEAKDWISTKSKYWPSKPDAPK
jgi:hypothetical protein